MQVQTTVDALHRQNLIQRDGSPIADYDYVGPGLRIDDLTLETGTHDVVLAPGYDGLGRMTRLPWSQMGRLTRTRLIAECLLIVTQMVREILNLNPPMPTLNLAEPKMELHKQGSGVPRVTEVIYREDLSQKRTLILEIMVAVITRIHIIMTMIRIPANVVIPSQE